MKLNKDGFKPGQILTEQEYLEARNRVRSKKDDSKRPRRRKAALKDEDYEISSTAEEG